MKLPVVSYEGKVIAVAIAGLLTVIALVAFLWGFDPFGRLSRAQQKAKEATAQSASDKAGMAAVDHYSHETIVIREEANAAVEQIRSAPTADQPLDPGLRAQLCAAGLCDAADRPDDHGSKRLP